MRDEVHTVLAACGQVLSVADLRALGLGPDEVQVLARGGDLVRIRRGTFVSGPVWRAAPPWERPALRARAVLRGMGPEPAVALSHHSSLAVQGVSVHGTDDRVHLCRLDDGKSREDDVVSVHRRVPEEFRIEIAVGPCVHVSLASLQVATRFGVEAGLVSADATLRERLATRAELEQALQVLRAGPRRAAAARVVDLASPLSESAGESRTRWVLLAVGLPLPEQQAEITDEHGFLVARVDFLFRREKVIVEFDGMLKYDDPAALRREKLREDRLRELGYEVVRLTWAALADPRLVERRLKGAFARSRARR